MTTNKQKVTTNSLSISSVINDSENTAWVTIMNTRSTLINCTNCSSSSAARGTSMSSVHKVLSNFSRSLRWLFRSDNRADHKEAGTGLSWRCSYRPISDLSLLGKVYERIVAQSISDLSSANLLPSSCSPAFALTPQLKHCHSAQGYQKFSWLSTVEASRCYVASIAQ